MRKIKRLLYFPIASYFAFFAKIILIRWNPRIVVITGSSGKTTLLHLIASQFEDKAKYTYKSNSAFGIPFNILGIKRETLSISEWPKIIFTAPFKIFKPIPKEKIYIVEADCDRPNEGKFLAKFLKPEVVMWPSLAKTHSMNFEALVAKNKFNNLEEVISNEFGYFVEYSKKLTIINSDSKHIVNQLKRSNVNASKISLGSTHFKYQVEINKTIFTLKDDEFSFKYLLPKETIYSIIMTKNLCKYFNIRFDKTFDKFDPPHGRSSFFKGIKGISIIDSSYNANLDSMKVIIHMFANIKTNFSKWVVLADMIEQGLNEENEHKLLASEINKYKFEKVILMGPRVTKYTKPELKQNSVSFMRPDEVLDYLKKEIIGGELILFKGARFLEGVIENLLLNKKDKKYLARREKVWEKRRKKFGL